MLDLTMEEVIEYVDTLPPNAQLRLIAHLVAKVESNITDDDIRYSWKTVEGIAPYPLLGEDAQTWISRTRREGDERREQQWN